jgi:hypothetical protein
MICPEQLETRFGGKAEDRKEGGYWPPRCNSDVFGQDTAVAMT